MDDADLKFIRSQSGIDDTDTLKQHIIAVQKKAYDVSGLSIICLRSNR
jgi:hypothetical protein